MGSYHAGSSIFSLLRNPRAEEALIISDWARLLVPGDICNNVAACCNCSGGDISLICLKRPPLISPFDAIISNGEPLLKLTPPESFLPFAEPNDAPANWPYKIILSVWRAKDAASFAAGHFL